MTLTINIKSPVTQTIPVVDIPVAHEPVASAPVASAPVAQALVETSADSAECSQFDFPPHFPTAAMPLVEMHDPVLCYYYSQRLYDQLLFTQRDHLLVALKERLDVTPLLQACASYHKNNGLGTDPTHTVGVLCRGLIIRYLYDLSYRKVEEQVRRDWLFRWFVGYPLFGKTFDHTTLADFEKWVRQQHLDLFFVEVLRQIYEDFPQEMEEPQMGDTFAMQANAAKETLIRLIRHTCHSFLSVFAHVNLCIYGEVMELIDREALLGKQKERPEFYLNKAQLKERQLKVAQEALKLYEVARPRLIELDPSPEVTKMSSRLNQLNKILNDEFSIKRDQNDKVTSFKKRDKPLKGAYRIGSATDPEATYRVHGEKSDFGFNIQIAATKNFVTAVYAETGAVPDQVTIPNVLTFQHEHFGFWPHKFIYDQAAGTGKVVATVNDVTDGNTQLVAQMVDYSKNSKRFGPADFTLSKDGETMTCPNGQTTDRKYRHGGGTGWSYRFIAPMCQGCPLLKECREDDQQPVTARNVYYSDHRAPYLQAVNYNQTEEFKADMKLRPNIERIIAGLVLHNGGRRARSRGITKADFQAKMNAMAYNIKRWMKLLAEKENPPKEKKKKGKYDLPALITS